MPSVRVRYLDWFNCEEVLSQLDAPTPCDAIERQHGIKDQFDWSISDMQSLHQCTLLLAADCVYDDRATSALVRVIAQLLPLLQPTAICLIALERRINFCLEGMTPRAPAAEHLESELRAHEELVVQRLPVSRVTQRFEYLREGNLELWKVFLGPTKSQSRRI